MGTIVQKLNQLSKTKDDIKKALELKGQTIGDIPFSQYSNKILQIESGSSNCLTGKVDQIGLSKIGWNEVDIQNLQNNVWWNSEDDDLYKLSEKEIELSNSMTWQNKDNYKTIVRFLPKLQIPSNTTSFYSAFKDFINLISLPILDTDNVTGFNNTFQNCYNLRYVPDLKHGLLSTVQNMFSDCVNLMNIPNLNYTNVSTLSGFITYNTKIKKIVINAPYSNSFFGNSMGALEELEINNGPVNTSINLSRSYSLRKFKMSNASLVNGASLYDTCLEYLELPGINTNIDISNSRGIINKTSLINLIKNAGNSNMTFKLNSLTYDLYNIDQDVVAALSNKTNITLAR